MITSERQYRVAQGKLKMLKESLSAPIKSGVPEALEKAARGQIKQLAEKVENEISIYEHLKNGAVNKILVHNIAEMYTAPIQFRIAKGWTLEQFAQFLKKDWRQILRYEQEEYQNATTSTLKEILEQIHIAISGSIEVKPKTTPTPSKRHLRPRLRPTGIIKKLRRSKSAAR